jgi:hypothetical protein
MSSANPLWGAPRIVGELAKIGIDIPRSTVAKYMVRRRRLWVPQTRMPGDLACCGRIPQTPPFIVLASQDTHLGSNTF